MANEVAFQFLTEQITALQVITQELTRMYLTITDLDEADQFRARITSTNQLLFALESARNNLEAAEPIPEPSAERLAALQSALKQLDAYVRSDQNLHMALNYLTQVANLVVSS